MRMTRYSLFFICLLATIFQLQAQDKGHGSLKGIVHTAKGEALPNATITIKKSPSAITDSTGRFLLLNLPAGRMEIIFSSAGYAAKTIIVHIPEGKEASMDVTLESEGFLNEVVITAGRNFLSRMWNYL